MSRRRSRWESDVYRGDWLVLNPAIPVGEIMFDEIGLHVDKPCTHTRGRIQSTGCIYAHSRSGQWPSMIWSPTQQKGAGFECMNSVYVLKPKLPQPPDVESAIGKMNAEICDYIREAGRSSLHAISFVREVSDTIAMLRNPFRILDFVRRHSGVSPKSRTSLKKCFKKAHSNAADKGVIDRAADTWLEGTYGWNPFVSDLLAAAEVLGSAFQSRKQLAAEGAKKFRLQKGGKQSVPISGYSSGGPYWHVFLNEGSVHSRWKAVYYGILEVSLSAQSESFLTGAARALNLDRLGYAVWDAVPYSCVADWFFPLGKTIDDTLSGPAFYTYSSLPWLSQSVTYTMSCSFLGNSKYAGGSGDTYLAGSASYVEEGMSFKRGQVDPEKLTLKSTTGMHGTRVASGLALAWGRFSR